MKFTRDSANPNDICTIFHLGIAPAELYRGTVRLVVRDEAGKRLMMSMTGTPDHMDIEIVPLDEFEARQGREVGT